MPPQRRKTRRNHPVFFVFLKVSVLPRGAQNLPTRFSLTTCLMALQLEQNWEQIGSSNFTVTKSIVVWPQRSDPSNCVQSQLPSSQNAVELT